jgi:hypothetical protein
VQLDQARKRHDRRIDEADLVMVAAHEVASPTERNYPNAEIVMHENEPAYWCDDEKCKGHQPGAEIVLSGRD